MDKINPHLKKMPIKEKLLGKSFTYVDPLIGAHTGFMHKSAFPHNFIDRLKANIFLGQLQIQLLFRKYNLDNNNLLSHFTGY